MSETAKLIKVHCKAVLPDGKYMQIEQWNRHGEEYVSISRWNEFRVNIYGVSMAGTDRDWWHYALGDLGASVQDAKEAVDRLLATLGSNITLDWQDVD